jgi:IS5 family transposase
MARRDETRQATGARPEPQVQRDRQRDRAAQGEHPGEEPAPAEAGVEHPFPVVKRQFGFTKVRYRGLAKNTARLNTLFMLSNLWMVRRRWT